MSPAQPISPQTNPSNRLLRGRRHAEPIRPLGYVTVALLVAFTLAASACSRGDAPAEATGSTAPPDVASDTPTTGTVSPLEEPAAGDATVALEWTEAGLSGETFIDQLLSTDQGFVAYRFAHGSQTWVSEDGIDWTPTDLVVEAATEDFFLGPITAGGPGYVAIGSDRWDNDVMWTSEDGFTWKRHELELEIPYGDFEGFEQLIAGPDSFLLQGFRTTSIEGEEGEGHEHPVVLAHSEDGLNWSLLPDRDTLFGPGAQLVEILSTSRGFVAEGHNGHNELWWAPDGRSWEVLPVDFLDSDSSLADQHGLALWKDKLLAVANTEDGIRLWASTDDRNWEPLPPSPTLDNTDQFILSVNQVAAGPLGIVLIGSLRPPRQPEPPVVIEKDNRILIVDLEAGRLTVTDRSTGDAMLDVGLDALETVVIFDEDAGSITVIDPDTGEELITITNVEFERAREKAYEDAGIEADPGFRDDQSTPVLWFSPDGRRWTSVGMQEMFGTPQPPTEVVVGNDAVIVRWSGWLFEGEEESEESPPASAAPLPAPEFGEDPPDVMWVGRLTDQP